MKYDMDDITKGPWMPEEVRAAPGPGARNRGNRTETHGQGPWGATRHR